MASQGNSTRQRLIQAALQLFAAQGMTETTTRQIAELAEVNEVTLFRHFGNKHGLLLAVIEEGSVFTQLGEALGQQAELTSNVSQALKDYGNARLQALEQIPELVRSLIGEAGQYPVEHRQSLGHAVAQANRYTAQYLATVMLHEQLQTHLPIEKLASLLNGLLLGYAVIEFTCEFHEWQDREDFLENLVELFLHGAVSQSKSISGAKIESSPSVNLTEVADLPANLVHSILQRARKLGLQDYALAYVLFGAGLDPGEIATLERSYYISDARSHLLQVTQGSVRQVPINQWIMGQRYGSYTRNPLIQWLKSRKDEHSPLFLNEAGNPISEVEIRLRWQVLTEGLLTLSGQPPAIEQAQQTWCVEMLMKGMNLEDLSILTSWDLAKLQPYARRAREKAALEQAIRLDHKPGSNVV
jgi:AcrR family transcriptional regulator